MEMCTGHVMDASPFSDEERGNYAQIPSLNQSGFATKQANCFFSSGGFVSVCKAILIQLVP